MFHHDHPFIWTLFYWGVLLLTILLSTYLSFGSYLIQVLFTLFLVASGYSVYQTLGEYGISWVRKSSGFLLLGFGIGFVCIAVVLVIEIGGSLLSPILQASAFISDILFQLLYFGLLQTIVAVVEELTFRGYILQNTIRSNMTSSILWTSVLFSLSHLPSIWFQAAGSGTPLVVILIMVNFLFIASILLCVFVVKTGSLWMSIGFHFSWNYFQYHVFGLTGGGFLAFSRADGFDVFHGGALGPEGGLVALSVIVVCVILVLFVTKRKSTQLSI